MYRPHEIKESKNETQAQKAFLYYKALLKLIDSIQLNFATLYHPSWG